MSRAGDLTLSTQGNIFYMEEFGILSRYWDGPISGPLILSLPLSSHRGTGQELAAAVFLEEAGELGELERLWAMQAACQPLFAAKVSLHPFYELPDNGSCSPLPLRVPPLSQVCQPVPEARDPGPGLGNAERTGELLLCVPGGRIPAIPGPALGADGQGCPQLPHQSGTAGGQGCPNCLLSERSVGNAEWSEDGADTDLFLFSDSELIPSPNFAHRFMSFYKGWTPQGKEVRLRVENPFPELKAEAYGLQYILAHTTYQ